MQVFKLVPHAVQFASTQVPPHLKFFPSKTLFVQAVSHFPAPFTEQPLAFVQSESHTTQAPPFRLDPVLQVAQVFKAVQVRQLRVGSQAAQIP